MTDKFNINNCKYFFGKIIAKMSSAKKQITIFTKNTINPKNHQIKSQSKYSKLHIFSLSQICNCLSTFLLKINAQPIKACRYTRIWKMYYVILKKNQAREVSIAY